MGLSALVVLLLADGSVLAVDLSGHVAATEVAAEEWTQLGPCSLDPVGGAHFL